MERVDALTRTEVDGVPVFTLSVPGPLKAMLAFRVGVVDETLPTRGITHLTEHLAMFRLMGSSGRYNQDLINARVEPLRTRFFATGTPDEVRGFLHDICASLTRLPVDRIENEKKILRTEAANRTTGSAKGGWGWRFGPSGLGLCDWEEYGLRWLRGDHVAQWAADNFTAQNAVLWLSGPVPQGMELNLPAGARKPLPDHRSLPFSFPGIFQNGDRFVLLSLLGPRDTTFVTARHVLHARLHDRVRMRESLAYNVNAGYEPVDKGTAEIAMFADSLQASSKAAAEAMAEEVNRLAAEGPTPEEIALLRDERRRSLEHPESGLGLLEQMAIAELEGRVPKTPEDLEADFEADSPGDVANVVKAAGATAFLGIPREVPMSVPGYTQVSNNSGQRIRGTRVFPMPGAKHADLIDYSSEGISLTAPNMTVVGMRWDQVTVALWWLDGSRTLINHEGAGLNVHPDRWREAQPLLDTIRAHVPAERWVPMDDPDALPRAEGPVCSVCKTAPALEVTFKDTVSFIWMRRNTVHGVLCRDCGIATFRSTQRKLLARAWWSIPGLILTPFDLLSNYLVCRRFVKMPAPIHTSGINPLPKGRSVLLHPAMLVPVGAVAYVLLLISGALARF